MNLVVFVLGVFFTCFGFVMIGYGVEKEAAHELINWHLYNYVEPATFRKIGTGIFVTGLVICFISLLVRKI